VLGKILKKIQTLTMKSAILIILLITLVHKSFQSPIDSQKNEVKNVDISIGLSCALNSSCIENVSNRIVRALKAKSSLDFGIFQIEPLVKNGKETEGRSLSKVWDFINGNSIRIPFGKYSVNLQRSAEHDNSLEFFIGQTVEGRFCVLIIKKIILMYKYEFMKKRSRSS
jgi:hypothetical protein